MSPGSACAQLIEVPAAPLRAGVARASGSRPCPARRRSARSSRTRSSLPQLLYSPPPRAQPLFGPGARAAAAPDVGQAQRAEAGGQPGGDRRVRRGDRLAGQRRRHVLVVRDLSPSVPVASTATRRSVDVPPPVDPKYLRNR